MVSYRRDSSLITGGICGGRSCSGAGTSLGFLRFPMLIIIPVWLHTLLSAPPEASDSPGQAAHNEALKLLDCNAKMRFNQECLEQNVTPNTHA